MEDNSPRFKTQQKILRISMIATVILITSVVWMNFERNQGGDKTLAFKNEALTEVLATVESTYKVTIEILNPELSTCRFTGTFVDKTLGELLEELRVIFHLELERVSARKYKISGNACRK